jgi:chromosomal replication initiation ATPase DnaA
MASAKFKIEKEEERPTPKRSALATLSLRWQEKAHARDLGKARAQVKTLAETELRLQVARERSVFGLTILPPPLPMAIIEQVAFWHDVPVSDLMSACRTDKVVEARYDAIAALALNCKIAGRAMSLTDIAHCLNRHHTSVLIALQIRGLR